MKSLLKIMLLLSLFVGMAACSDDDVLPEVKPQLEVNYANVSGTWRLTQWNGEKMDGDTRYYYISFDKKEQNGVRGYQIYTNINSFVAQNITGTFNLIKDEDYGDVIYGLYDYKLNADDEWEYDYMVKELYAESMKWVAIDHEDQVREYIRVDAVPDDIIKGNRSAFKPE